LGKHPRRALGCQRVGKTLAFYGIKAGCRRKEIETVTLGIATIPAVRPKTSMT
jgi:hypothetical protein